MHRPIPQEIYRHFKGNLYQIVTIAKHSETGEELVVYQALYGDFKVYCRPIDMFMSPVDRDKYPEVTQKNRFELVTELSTKEPAPQEKRAGEVVERPKAVFLSAEPKDTGKKMTVANDDSRVITPQKDVAIDNRDKTLEQEAESLNLHPLVVQFLDESETAARLNILSQMNSIITNDMIDIMSMAIDVQIDEGDVYQRFDDLKTCLVMKQRYEATRL